VNLTKHALRACLVRVRVGFKGPEKSAFRGDGRQSAAVFRRGSFLSFLEVHLAREL
jgi:hypothetical protein